MFPTFVQWMKKRCEFLEAQSPDYSMDRWIKMANDLGSNVEKLADQGAKEEKKLEDKAKKDKQKLSEKPKSDTKVSKTTDKSEEKSPEAKPEAKKPEVKPEMKSPDFLEKEENMKQKETAWEALKKLHKDKLNKKN